MTIVIVHFKLWCDAGGCSEFASLALLCCRAVSSQLRKKSGVPLMLLPASSSADVAITHSDGDLFIPADSDEILGNMFSDPFLRGLRPNKDLAAL